MHSVLAMGSALPLLRPREQPLKNMIVQMCERAQLSMPAKFGHWRRAHDCLWRMSMKEEFGCAVRIMRRVAVNARMAQRKGVGAMQDVIEEGPRAPFHEIMGALACGDGRD
jgi:hypothetical protein